MAVRAATTRYTRPGSYLSQVYQPRPTSAQDVVFRPCLIGKGSRLAMTKNATVTRGWRESVSLTFSTTPPYLATLPSSYYAKNDQSPPVRVYDGDGNEIPTTKWSFYDNDSDGYYESILFNAADYDRNKSYSVDYQSIVRTPPDDISDTVSGLRNVIRVGLYPNQDLYTENLTPATESSLGDFVVPGAVDTFSIDSSNTNASATVSSITKSAGSGTGTLAFGGSNSYSRNYSRYYKLSCTNQAASTATFKLEVWNHSGKNTAQPQVPLTAAAANCTFSVKDSETGILLPTNRQLIDGLYLSFTDCANFANDDVYVWWGYGPGLVEAHSAYDTSNTQFSSVSTPSASGNTDWTAVPPTAADNTSTSTCATGTSNEYTGSYIRHYKMQCTAAGGTQATGSVTLTAASIDNNDYVYIHNGVEGVYWEFQIDGTFVAAAPTPRITVDISGLADLAAGQALRAAINLDTNWPSGAAEMTATDGAAGVVNLENDHKGTTGNQTITKSEAVAGGIAIVGMSGATERTATIVWAGYDEMPYTTGSLSLQEDTSTTYTNVSLESGVYLTWTWGAFNSDVYFVVGDTWTFTARPGLMHYNAKDDRAYTLGISTAADKSTTGTYAADTMEGSFGTWTSTIADNGSGGLVELADNVKFLVRNAGNSANLGGVDASTRLAASDAFTFAATCSDTIDWAIDQRVTETFTTTIYDAIGAVTGVANTYYVILADTATSVIYVRDASAAAVSYTQVASSAYIYFTSDPITASNASISVKYTHRGEEPDPGQVYYISAYRLRASAEYDTAVLWRDSDACRDGLVPASTSNDLLIGAEIAKDAGGAGLLEWYTCQVRDLDDDGTYQLSDYKTAVEATSATSAITDVIVLNRFAAVPTAIREVEDCNDHWNFPAKVRMLWVGMPADSAIGDEDTASTTIYTQKHTLHVTGNSPSHGCHVLLGNTWATREVTLDDLSTTTVTLDGSFVAAAACCKQNGFSDIAETVLMKDLNGVFTTMEEFTDAEEMTLGRNNVLYLHHITTDQQRFYESVTTDASAQDYNEISATKQKHYVIRDLTSAMAIALTGWVPPDPYAAIALIKSYLAEKLSGLISRGVLAPYGVEQATPTRRKINPDSDIVVYQDSSIKTNYYYVCWFNLRAPVKRTSGLFGVDSDAFIKGIARSL